MNISKARPYLKNDKYTSKSTLTIDLSKIRANYRTLSKIVNKSIVGAVVKANCYGLGIENIAQALLEEGCTHFFVASIDEAVILRQTLTNISNGFQELGRKMKSEHRSVDTLREEWSSDISRCQFLKGEGYDSKIFVLNGIFNEDTRIFDEYKLIPVLNNLEQIQIWGSHAVNQATQLPSILHLNTGMHRLGIPYFELEIIQQNPEILEGLELLYVMSHLSASENADNLYNKYQLAKFKNYLQYFPGIKASLANSSSIFLGEDYYYDLVRPGAALYGINPTPLQSNPMQHVISLTSPIIQLQTLPAGTAVSYNMTFVTSRDTTVATIPIGYADGYPRSLSNRGAVYIAGRSCPVVGTISMDLTVIDVTDLPLKHVFLGQQVEIIGDNYTIDQLANDSSTISYEILTRLGNR